MAVSLRSGSVRHRPASPKAADRSGRPLPASDGICLLKRHLPSASSGSFRPDPGTPRSARHPSTHPAHLLSLYISGTPFRGCVYFDQGVRVFTSVYMSLAHMHGGGDL
ncbi:hypothetical protein ACLOJK_038917 [Asimina triloba]